MKETDLHRSSESLAGASAAEAARRPRCAVVGAANTDIGGFAAEPIAPRDSSPGRVVLSAGGVGRNIACNLARLGMETHLVAALGGDAFAGVIRDDCARAGVRLDLAPSFEDASSSAYLFIADADGDMRLAVNDMDICARLTPAALEPLIDALNAMDAVVLDANLSSETLDYLAANLRVPLLADAVSAAKAPRLAGALPRLRALKPNALEAEALTGLPAATPDGAAQAAEALVAMGLARAFVSLGDGGVCCADGARTLRLPSACKRVVSATGAGDAFTAALAWADLRGLSLRESALAGLAAAAIAAEALPAVSPAMSEAALLERLGAIEKQMHDL